MLKLALELITLDTYLKEIRTFVKVESMKCFILTLESTIVIVTSMTSFVEYQFRKGVIQQLRGQEEGEGGQPKVHACPPGGEGSLECPCGPKPSFFRNYFIPLCTVMGGKKEIITLN